MSNSFQKRLNSLKPYVISIRFVPDLNMVIDVLFKNDWTIPKSTRIKSSLGEEDMGPMNYHMIYSEDDTLGVDELLDFVETTINHNIEREKKIELLQVKFNELKALFTTTSLSKLKTLKFVMGDEPLINDIMTDFRIDDTHIEPEEVPVVAPAKEETVAPLPEPEVVHQNVDDTFDAEPIRPNWYGNQDMELPPKGEKIVIEEFDIPKTNQPCNCGPDQACPNCIDTKY